MAFSVMIVYTSYISFLIVQCCFLAQSKFLAKPLTLRRYFCVRYVLCNLALPGHFSFNSLSMYYLVPNRRGLEFLWGWMNLQSLISRGVGIVGEAGQRRTIFIKSSAFLSQMYIRVTLQNPWCKTKLNCFYLEANVAPLKICFV